MMRLLMCLLVPFTAGCRRTLLRESLPLTKPFSREFSFRVNRPASVDFDVSLPLAAIPPTPTAIDWSTGLPLVFLEGEGPVGDPSPLPVHGGAVMVQSEARAVGGRGAFGPTRQFMRVGDYRVRVTMLAASDTWPLSGEATFEVKESRNQEYTSRLDYEAPPARLDPTPAEVARDLPTVHTLETARPSLLVPSWCEQDPATCRITKAFDAVMSEAEPRLAPAVLVGKLTQLLGSLSRDTVVGDGPELKLAALGIAKNQVVALQREHEEGNLVAALVVRESTLGAFEVSAALKWSAPAVRTHAGRLYLVDAATSPSQWWVTEREGARAALTSSSSDLTNATVSSVRLLTLQ